VASGEERLGRNEDYAEQHERCFALVVPIRHAERAKEGTAELSEDEARHHC
jgi:hypothetical protein